jgi:hypothetical protein
MKEIETEAIKIDGNPEIFGGKIYNASFTNNFSNSPSTITINIVNETGDYETPTLNARSVQEAYEIEVGDKNLGQYSLIKTRTSVNKSGKVLELTFFDASMSLDKIYIGLHKKHGIIPRFPVDESGTEARKKSYNKKDILASLDGLDASDQERPAFHIQRTEDEEITPLILMGREFHPCDTNRDGYLNLDEDIFKVDGCDPCPNCPEDKYDGSLDRQRCLDLECTEIFDVRYNFASLIEAIKAFFEEANIEIVVDESIPETNDKYYAQYEGTLREVLKRWGADFSFNFYFEHNAEGEPVLKFIDTKVEADIIGKEELENENIITFEETQSIENTKNSGSVSLYKQGGERKVYNCNTSVKLDLKPITLSDLYNDTNDEAIMGKEPEDGSDLVSFEDLEISIALAKYSTALREHFWWGKMYGADRNREAIVQLQYIGPAETTSSPSAEGEDLTFQLRDDIEGEEGLGGDFRLTRSEGIDGLKPDTLVEIAQQRGIPQLGSLKALAFFFPRDADDTPAVTYYNKGTRFGQGPGEILDHDAKAIRKIKELWNPTPEEEDFFAKVPLFGGEDISVTQEGDGGSTIAVESFSRGYFMLASRKDALLDKVIENEKRLGSEFIGKYFAKEIDATDKLSFCGYDKYKRKDYSRKNITIKGGGTYYDFDDPSTKKFLESPLFDFGHSQGSVVGRLQEKVQNKEIRIVQDDENVFDQGVVIQQASNNWYPQEGATNEIKTLLDIYERKRMKEIKVTDKATFANLIKNYAPEHISDDNVKLFVVYPDDFSSGFDIERDQLHPSIKVNSTESRGRDVSSGCYGDCEDDTDCFSGEKNPERLAKLEIKLSELKENSTAWRATKREIDGDTCKQGECVDSNFCSDDVTCGSFDVLDGETFSEYQCIKGECIEKLGLQSSVCTRVEVNGFKIYAPPHGFDTPSGKRIMIPSLDTFDPRSYRAILEYQKQVEVFIPKVEHMIQENIEQFETSFAKFNINLYQTPVDDLNLFYRKDLSTQQCTPSDELLEKLHEEFNLNLTHNIEQPRRSIKISIAGISDQIGSEMITKGLESFNINISSDGVTSNYVFGNRIMQPVSIDVTRRLIDSLQRRTSRHSNYTQATQGLIN